MSSHQLTNQHLLWRAAFGPSIELIPQISNASPQGIYEALKKASAKSPVYLKVADDQLQGLYMGIREAARQQREVDPKDRRQLQQKQREGIRNLNLAWLHEMVNSKSQLREKMAFFWHGHFACRNLNVFFQQQLLDIIRRNALGSFRQLLIDVSTAPAMLNFLNNTQNRKGQPNENFAREVMELFTMGRGQYDETDIKEAARAFTGWSVNGQGEFIFRRFQHDNGLKQVLGQSGNFDGYDILDMLLEKRETAHFITTKIYKFLVNEEADSEKITWLSKRFYENDYAILPLLDDIFLSDWFFNQKNVGIKIKSPVELLVGIQRLLPMEVDNPEVWLQLQRLLGQVLFYPPNVAGWPGGKSWIDSSSLLIRMRLPSMIAAKEQFELQSKTDDDQAMGMDNALRQKGMPFMLANIEWESFLHHFSKSNHTELIRLLSNTLLQVPTRLNENDFQNIKHGAGREENIKSLALQIMSTPEYQLC